MDGKSFRPNGRTATDTPDPCRVTKKVSGGWKEGNMQVGILQIQQDCPVVLAEQGKHCREKVHPEEFARLDEEKANSSVTAVTGDEEV